MGSVENIKSIMQWGNSFERQGNFPLDRTDLHISYDDAVLYAKGDASDSRKLGKLAYIGQTITVWGLNEKGVEGVWVYSLVPHTPVDENDTTLADLKPVGSATTETATNYSAAKTLSQSLAVGQLIQVAESEEVEETIEGSVVKNTYQAGFYIVNAPGSISALGTSSGADDEIGALETRISLLEANKLAKTDFETYQGEVTTALDAKVDDSDFTEYQTTVTTALNDKATVKDLDDLEVKVNEDIQNLTTLTGRVDADIQNLTTLLGDYSGTLGDVDDRLGELEDFVDGHVYHGSIETSDIIGLFDTKSE